MRGERTFPCAPVQELVPMGKELFWAQGAAGLVVIQGRSQKRRWEGSGDGGG